MMPQEFRVVQCYNCKTFQVDITKKVPKWLCKICGEKQSVTKIYGNGSAKECRLYVQDLNEKRIRFETEEGQSECHLENKVQREQLLTNEEEDRRRLEFMQNNENNEEIFCDQTEKNSVNKSDEANLVNCIGKRELETDNLKYMQREQLLTKEEDGGSKWLEFMQNNENNEEIKSNEVILVNCFGKRKLETDNPKYMQEQLLTNEEKGSKWLEFMQNDRNYEEIICDKREKSSGNKPNEAILVNCKEKRELKTNNLNYKKFKPNSNVKKIDVFNVRSKNIFDSENYHDIDSLLDI